MLLRRLHIFLPLLLTLAPAASCATLLVLPLENASQYHDLNWVGESAAETLSTELGAHEIVLDRAAREDGLRRLSLRTGAQFTKATLIKLGQTLGADYLCYGTYEIKLPASNGQLRDASLRLELRFLDLRKLQDGPAYSEAGKLTDLSRLEEHLAWQSLVYLEPQLKPSSDQFLQAQKLVTFDAKESYVRGLLTANPEQRERLFLQAIRLAPQYTRPIFELGSVALARKDYRQAIEYLKKIPATDSQHMDAQFKLGIAYFGASDYPSAVHSFSELQKKCRSAKSSIIWVRPKAGSASRWPLTISGARWKAPATTRTIISI